LHLMPVAFRFFDCRYFRERQFLANADPLNK
jgi:hypothetical protein